MAAGLIGGSALLLAILGAPMDRRAASPPTPIAAPPPSVAVGGVTLASARIALPDDTEVLPAGPHAELVNARCTACHSAAMILSQPPLSAEQWTAEVTKMREAYHAPVPAADTPAIVAYLSQLKAPSAGRPGPLAAPAPR